MRTDLAPVLDTQPVIAVVGATDDPAKYGSRIYRDLKRKGFSVVAVNPNRVTVDGDTAYPSLAALPSLPHLIDLVVPAEVGIETVKEAVALGLDNIWVQPGAESPALTALLVDSGLAYSLHDCIMVRSRPPRRD